MDIFLDMDQTLTNWEKGVADYLNIPMVTEATGFDAWLSQRGEDAAGLWAKIGKDERFWRTLPSLPEAVSLFKRLKRLGRVRILSSCGLTLGPIAQAKEQWLKDKGIDAVLIPLKEKELLAQSGRVLIDDSEKNCKAWVAAGGVAVLFPSRETASILSHRQSCNWCIKIVNELKDAGITSGLKRYRVASNGDTAREQ